MGIPSRPPCCNARWWAQERIAVDWIRDVVAFNRVNPLDLGSEDQIHAVDESPQAISSDCDLVYAYRRESGGNGPYLLARRFKAAP